MRSSLIILPLAALLACGGGGSDSTGPGTTGGTAGGTGGTGAVATTAVSMKNIAFTPEAIKVASGAVVTWTNNDGFAHNVTFDGGAVPASNNIDAGVAKAMTMPTAAGTYTYKCTIHSGMTGSVQVQ
jgi:plastocyanin